MLHSSFWCHGAGNIELAPWWSLLLQTSRALSVSRPSVKHRQRYGSTGDSIDWMFLDFLYPAQTLSFLQRCSTNEVHNLVNRRRKTLSSHASRLYTSSTGEAHAQVEAQALEDISSEPQEEHGSVPESPLQSLQELLQSDKQEEYSRAWHLYEGGKGAELVESQLLAYLARSDRQIDAERSKFLFDAIPLDRRKSEDYQYAILTALRLGDDLVYATAVCKEAVSRSEGSRAWTHLFSHLIANKEWAHAVELWKAAAPSTKENNFDLNKWDDVNRSTVLPSRLLSLAEHMTEHAKDADFLDLPRYEELALSLFHKMLGSTQIMTDVTKVDLVLVMQELQNLGLVKVKDFVWVIKILTLLKSRNRIDVAAMLYRNLQSRTPFQPRQNVLGALLKGFCDAEDPKGIDYILDEFRTFHTSPDQQAFQIALTAFARLGDIDKVHQLFEEFSTNFGKPKDQAYLTPLLYVHARVGHVQETLAQFDRLSTDFGVNPNIISWNIVLAAYANAEDFDGALKRFQTMLKQGFEPDAYSFGTLMGVAANIGDKDGVHYLVDFARERGIKGTTAMIDTLVETYCRNDELDEAESLVEVVSKMDLDGSCTRMWNRLICTHAFRADPDAVLRLQERMREADVPPDGMTYAALMQSLVSIGKPKAAHQILKELHRKDQVSISMFHYAILLNAYAKKGDSDMVNVLYKEILEHFERPSLSARLSMLLTKIRGDMKSSEEKKDMHEEIALPQAQEFLEETLEQLDVRDFATKEPQPGTRGQPLSEVYPSAFFEYMIAVYGTRGAFHKVEELFDRYRSLGQYPDEASKDDLPPPIRLLSSLMLAHLHQGQFAEVAKCWEMAIPRAIHLARQPDVLSSLPSSAASSNPGRPPSSPPVPSIPASSISPFTPSPSLPASKKTLKPFEDPTIKILPSQRFLLSTPLTHYMRSLSEQNLHSTIPLLLHQIESAGFALTTKNWNAYIQMLSRSPDPKDQMHAYTLFEEKFLPNMPDWRQLKRSQTLHPYDREPDPAFGTPPALPKRLARILKATNPGYLQPSYLTMVFLGAAMMDFRERSVLDGGVEIEQVRAQSPGTFEAVVRMPYLRDRAQGVLLRGRQVVGDKRKAAKSKKKKQQQPGQRTGLLEKKEGEDELVGESLISLTRYDKDEAMEWISGGHGKDLWAVDVNVDEPV